MRKLIVTRRAGLAGVAVLSWALAGTACGQSASSGNDPSPGRQSPVLQRGSTYFGTLLSTGQPVSQPRDAALRKLYQLRDRLAAAQSASDKAPVKEALLAALGEYFAADMNLRQEELERLNQRADAMEQVLARRLRARDQLVDLQVKSLQYEADGLGLFSKDADSRPAVSLFNEAIDTGNFAGALSLATRTDMAIPLATARTGIKRNTKDDPLETARMGIKSAYEKLRRVEPGASPDAALGELRAALGEYFDRDMDARRKELAEVKQGLDAMAAGLARRATAQEDIIDLQMQIIENEAEGLGFFSGTDPLGSAGHLPTSSSSSSYGSGTGRQP